MSHHLPVQSWQPYFDGGIGQAGGTRRKIEVEAKLELKEGGQKNEVWGSGRNRMKHGMERSQESGDSMGKWISRGNNITPP